MTPRKVSLQEMFGTHPTREGKAAVRRATEYAAKEQMRILAKARELGSQGR